MKEIAIERKVEICAHERMVMEMVIEGVKVRGSERERERGGNCGEI